MRGSVRAGAGKMSRDVREGESANIPGTRYTYSNLLLLVYRRLGEGFLDSPVHNVWILTFAGFLWGVSKLYIFQTLFECKRRKFGRVILHIKLAILHFVS